MKSKPFERIYAIVSKIPKGKVMTYKQIAHLTDVNPRVVGFAMHGNKDTKRVPCHRVVAADGSLRGYAMGGIKVKQQKLEEEGVMFTNDKVDLEKSLYRFS